MRRVNMLVWGPAGSGRRQVVGGSPEPRLTVSLTKGTWPPGALSHADEVAEKAAQLYTEEMDAMTVVLDDVSTYYGWLQWKWGDIAGGDYKEGHNPEPTMKPADIEHAHWRELSKEWQQTMDRLRLLDANTIFLAGEKWVEGRGLVPDCKRSLPHEVDVVLRMERGMFGRGVAHVERDATGALALSPVPAEAVWGLLGVSAAPNASPGANDRDLGDDEPRPGGYASKADLAAILGYAERLGCLENLNDHVRDIMGKGLQELSAEEAARLRERMEAKIIDG